MRWLAASAGVLGVLGAAVYMKGPCPVLYLSVPALLVVGAGVLVFLLGNYEVAALWRALGRGAGQGGGDAEGRQAVLSSAYHAAHAMGVLGFFVGLIGMLVQLSDPASIGPNVALSLLCVLYGVFLAEVVIRSLMIRGAQETRSSRGNVEGLGGPVGMLLLVVLGMAEMGVVFWVVC